MVLQSGEFKRITPYALKEKIERGFENNKYGGNMQHDAHELMGDILNKVGEEIRKFETGVPSGGIFNGMENCHYTCNKCKQDQPNVKSSSTKKDPFNSLHIQLKEGIDNHQLEQCLKHLSKVETVERFCDKCLSNQPTSKKTEISQYPEMLIIHLKRFENKGPRWVKNNSSVDFPRQLTLPADVTSNQKSSYRLQSVIMHYMEVLREGTILLCVIIPSQKLGVCMMMNIL